jgi:hypothetical protein
MLTALTKPEAIQLEELETVIHHGIKTFTEVGNALLAIRDGRLYKAEYGTFEAYCWKRWEFAASRARQLIGAAAIVENLKSVTTVTLPQSERVARALAKLPAADQPTAWQAATDKAQSEGRTVRARDVEETVEEKRTKEDATAQPATDESRGPSKGVRLASEAIACLSRIPKNDRTRAEAWSMVSNWLKANK